MESIEAEEEEEEPYSSSSKKGMYPEESTSPPRQKRPRNVNSYQSINWLRSSKLLQNVGKKYATPEDCLQFSVDDYIIIGMDPGERNTMTATRLDPRRSSDRTTVTIRRSFLYHVLTTP
ncbi:hypothetical protein BGX28_006122 [Mortierella sp. GBA30]|nr:hypothetical protein BGX28_006122 [Mortierella sp. GBA30]